MADTKISALPTGTAIFGNDVFPFTHGITGSAAPETQRAQFVVLEDYLKPTFQGLNVVEGRLSLASGTAVTTTDQTAKTSIWYNNYIGNKIVLYNGTAWAMVTVTVPVGVAVPNASGTVFDVFGYISNGVLALETTNWTNGTTRATALTTQNGVLVKSGDVTRRYLGTGRTHATGQCEDSEGAAHQAGGKRFLWNYYNRVPKQISVKDTTNNWSYTTDTVRQANGATGNKVELVIGVAEDVVEAVVFATTYLVSNSLLGAKVGIGIDSTTTISGYLQAGYNSAAAAVYTGVGGGYRGVLSAGYHYIAWLEKGADGSTCLILGDNNETNSIQSGLYATVRA